MDTQRLILFFVFSFSLLLLWDSWQKEHRPPVQASAQIGTKVPGQATVPSPSAPTQVTPVGQHASGNAIPPAMAGQAKQEKLSVKTDNFVADIDLLGGDIVRLELLKQKDALDQETNFVLFTPVHHYAAESGLIGPGLPTHKTLYTAEANQYALSPGEDKLQVRLHAPGPDGVKTVKILTFYRGSYVIDISHARIAGLDRHDYRQRCFAPRLRRRFITPASPSMIRSAPLTCSASISPTPATVGATTLHCPAVTSRKA